jgi:uncharacterized membrane protein
MIAWQSLPGGQLETFGSVRFKRLGYGRGTAVAVSLKYQPPAGKIGASVASFLGGGLKKGLEEDLRRFKGFMETGEVATA